MYKTNKKTVVINVSLLKPLEYFFSKSIHCRYYVGLVQVPYTESFGIWTTSGQMWI